MYSQLQEKLQTQYSKLPNYKVEFGVAYSQAVSKVGDQNRQNLENAIIAILDVELQRYISTPAKTRGGRLGRFAAKIASAFMKAFKK